MHGHADNLRAVSDGVRRPDSAIRIARLTYGELRSGHDAASWTGLTRSQADMLRAHPFARDEDIVVIGAEGAVGALGRLIMIPGRASVDGTLFPLSWSSGWEAAATAPGAGSLLLLGAIRAAGSFGACLMSDEAMRVIKAARWSMARLPRLVLLRRSASYWRQAFPSPVSRVAATPTDLALAALRTVSRTRQRPDRRYVVGEVARFDERVGEIDAARTETRYFERRHDELNWAMAGTWDPEAHATYLGFLIRERDSTEALGYALTRTRSYGAARTSSIFRTAVRSGRPAVMRELLRAIVERLEQDDPDMIDVAGTDAVLLDAARTNGMFQHGGIDIGCHFGPALKATGARLAQFRIDMAEGDVLLL